MNRRGFPSLAALLGLLAIAGYQNRDKIAEMLNDIGKGRKAGSGQSGGLTDLLAGLNVGALLNGGLGELLEKFRQAGQQETAESWIGSGPNRDVTPDDLKTALGPDMLQSIAQATGLSEQELLARLSHDLPSAVDKYTPDGRIAHGN